MKTRFIGALILSLLISVPALSQTSGGKVVATHIEYGDSPSELAVDVLRDVNTYLHGVFERNGFKTASIENEDRVMSNLLNAVNFRDAEVRSQKGEPIDYVYTIWVDKQGDDYKFYSKRQGRLNTDFKLGNPIAKSVSLLNYKPNSDIRELIALQIAEQFINLSSKNKNLLDTRERGEQSTMRKIQQGQDDFIAGIEAAKHRDKILTWFAPSYLHIENGRIASGALLFSGELISVGGGIFTYAKANSLVKTLKEDDWSRKRNDGTAMTDFERANLEKQYKTCQVVNYICWGSAAILYAVNVATSYKIISDKRYAIVPSIQQSGNGDYAYGVALTYRF